jgi:hypothetical protein
MKKTTFCFYVGRKFITEVIANTPGEAWFKAGDFHQYMPAACPRPAGICMNSDRVGDYLKNIK